MSTAINLRLQKYVASILWFTNEYSNQIVTTTDWWDLFGSYVMLMSVIGGQGLVSSATLGSLPNPMASFTRMPPDLTYASKTISYCPYTIFYKQEEEKLKKFILSTTYHPNNPQTAAEASTNWNCIQTLKLDSFNALLQFVLLFLLLTACNYRMEGIKKSFTSISFQFSFSLHF